MATELLRCKSRSCRHRGPLPHTVEEGETPEVLWTTKRCEFCGRFTRALWSKNPDAIAPEGVCPDCRKPWDDCACEFEPDEVEVHDQEGGTWLPAWNPDPDWEDEEPEWETEDDWDGEGEEDVPAPAPSDHEIEVAGQLTLQPDDDLPF